MPLPRPTAPPSRHRASTDRILPPEGRSGPPPKWPSGHKPNRAEAALWRRLWSLPQAVAWAELPGVEHVVARYVRVSAALASDLDTGNVKAALLAQLRGMESDLGLNPVALARLRWRVGDDDQAGQTVVVHRLRERPRAIDPALIDRRAD